MKNAVVLALAASVLACGTGYASEAKTDLYKHYGVAYASSTACNFFEMPDGFEVTEKRMGIKLLQAQESPIWRAAYDKQLAKLNKAKPKAKAAECARVYKLYGPKGSVFDGYLSKTQ